jgi:FAD/FMN-containing dehydrogenase
MSSEAQLTGRVVWPHSPGYAEARQEYNARFDRYPAVVVFARETADVQNAVRWARAQTPPVPIRMRCGRHSYEGFSVADGAIVIDVSEMTAIEVDSAARVARVQAGWQLWPLYEELWKYGMTIPGGSCPTVGVTGLTLGGGFGLVSRLFGLTCDSLLGVEMVNAEGDVVVAGEDAHRELLWASRGGGGGNFGVVTALTFRLHPVGDVAIYKLEWAWDDIRAVTEAWQAWAPGADERLVSILKLTAKSSGTVSSIGELVGSAKELGEVLGPFLQAAPSPRQLSIREMPYIDAVRYFAGKIPHQLEWSAHHHAIALAAGQGQAFKNTSAYAYRRFDSEALDVIERALAEAPSSLDLVQLDNYGGAVNRVPPEATAFYHRHGVLWNMQYQAYWSDPADEAPQVAWVERFRRAMLPHTHGAYVNYCDLDIADWPVSYFGRNFAKLVEVKAKYDPEDVFRFAQGIPPALTVEDAHRLRLAEPAAAREGGG